MSPGGRLFRGAALEVPDDSLEAWPAASTAPFNWVRIRGEKTSMFPKASPRAPPTRPPDRARHRERRRGRAGPRTAAVTSADPLSGSGPLQGCQGAPGWAVARLLEAYTAFIEVGEGIS